jgi:hypothetical protein
VRNDFGIRGRNYENIYLVTRSKKKINLRKAVFTDSAFQGQKKAVLSKVLNSLTYYEGESIALSRDIAFLSRKNVRVLHPSYIPLYSLL